MKNAMNTQQTIRTRKQPSTPSLLAALAVVLVAGGVWLSAFAQQSATPSPGAQGRCSMGQGMKCGMMGTNCMMAKGTNMCCASTNHMKEGHMASCPMMQAGSTNHMMGGKMASCSMMQSSQTNAPASQAAYTCPMHPEVGQDKPGKCPKCGMRLVAKR